jgi:SAM-dependent methyltransferase
VDIAICSNILFQVEDKEKFILEIKRILKNEGKVLFIDWADASILGPKKDKIISKDKVTEMFKNKGFKYDRDISAGEHHYGMILINK